MGRVATASSLTNRKVLAAVLAVPVIGGAATQVRAQTALWWDTNGTIAGTSGSGTWSASAANWTTGSAGTTTTGTWVSGDRARFSAGTNGTGAFTVTVSGTMTVDEIGLEEGTVTFTGGALSLGQYGANNDNFLLGIGGTATNATVNSKLTGSNGLRIFSNSSTAGGAITIGSTSNDFTGGVTVGVAATLTLGASNVIPDGNLVTLQSGTLNVNGKTETIAGLASGSASSNIQLGAGTLTLALGTGNASFYGNDITGTGGIVMASGTQIISTNYSYTGPTTLNGGTLKVDSLRNAGQTSSIGASTTANSAANLVFNGGTMEWLGKETINTTGGQSTNRNYTLGANGGTIVSDDTTNGLTFAGAMTVSATSGSQTFTLGGAGGGTISGVIKDGGGTNKTNLTKTGTGTWTLGGANTNHGATTISAGTLKLGNASAGLGDDSAVSIASGATFNMNGTADTIGSIAGAGSIINGTGLILSGNNASAVTFSGSYTGSGGLTKNGSGTQVLSGSNSFSSVTVNGGSLVANNGTTGHATGLGVVTVNALSILTTTTGGTVGSVNVLAGGTITAAPSKILIVDGDAVIAGTSSGNIQFNGDVVVTGTIAPGNSPGVDTVAGDLTLSGEADMQLAGTDPSQYDQINVTGTLNFGGDLDVTLIDSFTPALGNTFDLFDFNGHAGTFANIVLPGLDAGLMWDLSSLYTTGEISVAAVPVETAVPLPAAAWGGLGLLGGLAMVRRVRKTQVV